MLFRSFLERQIVYTKKTDFSNYTKINLKPELFTYLFHLQKTQTAPLAELAKANGHLGSQLT